MSNLKIENESDFVRSQHSRGLLNVDHSGLQAYKLQKHASRKSAEKLTSLNNDVMNIKEEIHEIKNLLVKLLDK